MITNGAEHRHAGEHRHRQRDAVQAGHRRRRCRCRPRTRRRAAAGDEQREADDEPRAPGRATRRRARRARRGSVRRGRRGAPARARPRRSRRGRRPRRRPRGRRSTCRLPTGISEPTHQRDQARAPAPSPSSEAEQRCPTTPIEQRLEQDRAGDQPARGAERAQHADLAHALQHGHVERVEDQEAADEQRDAREEVEDDVQRVELLRDLVAEALRAS